MTNTQPAQHIRRAAKRIDITAWIFLAIWVAGTVIEAINDEAVWQSNTEEVALRTIADAIIIVMIVAMFIGGVLLRIKATILENSSDGNS